MANDDMIDSFVKTGINVGLYNAPNNSIGTVGHTKQKIIDGIGGAFQVALQKGANFGTPEIPNLESMVGAKLNEGVKRGDYICVEEGEETIYALSTDYRAVLYEKLKILGSKISY